MEKNVIITLYSKGKNKRIFFRIKSDKVRKIAVFKRFQKSKRVRKFVGRESFHLCSTCTVEA